ncbi:MAG: protocatechuate 3,4-dioxygenase, partial [Alphaproteobacteria bacterium]|nr:protocatechuate 3,4-dioxygenase [Alphaproteobacteria bacterium]
MVFDRRALMGGMAAAAVIGNPAARAASCLVTPDGPEGPFYPPSFAEADLDMTRIAGSERRADGTVIEVIGRVIDDRCQPIANAEVDVWQANAVGRYSHPRDSSNPRPLDAGFQGQARLRTDADGAYRYLTIVPGAYPVSSSWWRPPHIHYRVSQGGQIALTTQLYFAGEDL